jgi:hypothetical protein
MLLKQERKSTLIPPAESRCPDPFSSGVLRLTVNEITQSKRSYRISDVNLECICLKLMSIETDLGSNYGRPPNSDETIKRE